MPNVPSTNTTHANWIPELWSKEMIIARESKLIMSNLVWRFDFDVASFGDIIHVPQVSNLVGGNISTSTGLLDAETVTESEVQITVDKWKGVNMQVLDITLAQAKYEFRKRYTDKMGYVLGQLMEQDLTALATSATNNVGTYNTDLTDANLRRAVQYLDDARVPFEDRHILIKPAQKNNFLGIDKFVLYKETGKAGIVNVGQVPGEIYGATVHVSPETYITGSNTSNLMFHKEFMALAVQKNIRFEEFARQGWLDWFGASELYGVKVMRADHAVELKS